MNPQKLDRINVVGTSGSGKSHFSKELARRLSVPYVELDLLFWGPNWTQPADEVFLEKIQNALSGDRWILDGNYNRTLPIKWKNVTTVIWLDYSLPRVLFQAVKRALSRIIARKELWPGTNNKESFRRSFLSKESILLWTLKTHGSMKTRYEPISIDPTYNHIQFLRLRSPKEAKSFLEAVRQ